MLFLKRGLMAAGALALAAMLLNFVAPNGVHAAVATLVQVVNTAATPVPNRDVDAAGRNAYILQCYNSSTGDCTTGPVPAGATFVLDSLSVYGQVTSGEQPSLVQIDFTPPGSGATLAYFLPLTTNQVPGYISSVTTNLTVYAAAGSVVWCGIQGGGAFGRHVVAIFVGHLVSTP